MHIPRKRFGQHFLCDQGIVQRIVASIAPRATDHLIEIGPGQGALTLPILKQTRQLEVIELDRDLIPQLEDRCAGMGRLTIHSADALEVDFASLQTKTELLRVFGNLPYNVSTPLIFHLLKFSSSIADMVFMLQKEVAARMAAQASDDDYGRLSVMVQYHCRVELLFDVPPTAFYPPPQVTSSIVQLFPYRQFPVVAKNYATFAALVKQAFGQRRKTLRNSLKEMLDDAAWEKVGIDPKLRPENLTVNEFVELANSLS